MKGKRVGALLLSVVLTMSLLGGCGSRSQITEDMIPDADEQALYLEARKGC